MMDGLDGFVREGVICGETYATRSGPRKRRAFFPKRTGTLFPARGTEIELLSTVPRFRGGILLSVQHPTDQPTLVSFTLDLRTYILSYSCFLPSNNLEQVDKTAHSPQLAFARRQRTFGL